MFFLIYDDVLHVLRKVILTEYFQELLNSTSRVVEENVGRQSGLGEVRWMKILMTIGTLMIMITLIIMMMILTMMLLIR